MCSMQACRGTKFDDGQEVSDADVSDDTPNTRVIPIEADFLYAYSTIPGHWCKKISSSFAYENSTFFIAQTVCGLIVKYWLNSLS